MRAAGKHGMRPTVEALLISEMKLRGCGSELVKVASDIVQRDQAVVTVKGRIFQALGHHGAGELLELHGEGRHCIFVGSVLPFGDGGQKNIAYEVKDTSISGRTSPFC